MKLFIIKLVLFLFIVKLVDVGLYKVGELYLLNEAYSYGNLSRVYSGKINTDILFFGSSRIYLHINPEVVEENSGNSSYNLGKDGTSIEQALFTLEEYLLHNNVPKIVVFNADVTQLDKRISTFQKEKFRKYQYYSMHTMNMLDYSFLKKLSIILIPSQTFSNQGIGDLINGIKYFFTRKRQQYSSKKDFGDWLFVKGAHLKKDSFDFEINDTPIKFQLDQSRKDVFDKLVILQRHYHFFVVLLESPILSKLDPEVSKSGRDFFEAFAEDNEGVLYLSFANDKDLLGDRQLWFNAGHLNILGANILSKKVAIIIKDQLTAN